MTTPKMSEHARQRCAEMGISTKIAKRIVQQADVLRPGKPGCPAMVATSDQFPEYAVVVDLDDNKVVTVLFRTDLDYTRDGSRFIAKEAS